MILKRFRKLGLTQQLRIGFIGLFAYPIGLWCLWEFGYAMNDVRRETVPARVMSRNEIDRFGGIPGARLDISINNSDERVYAILAHSDLHTFPDDIEVHYSGAPNSEVRIHGEESPFYALAGGVLLWLVPIALTILYGLWNSNIERELNRQRSVDA